MSNRYKHINMKASLALFMERLVREKRQWLQVRDPG